MTYQGLFFRACGIFVGASIPTLAMAQAADEDAQIGVGEIIVTATKQAQNLQRTPAAVTAITGDQLTAAGVTNLAAAQAAIPSTRLMAQASTVEIFIRGIGSNNDFANTEPPTAFNIEGVYLPREVSSTPLFDLARIEVLPGPQGTLYGRSTLGGAVNVVFQRPTNELQSKGLLEGGNYSLLHGTMTQNLPISDNLAVRAGVDYQYHTGYLKSGAGSANNLSGRLSAQWKPTSNFTAYVWTFVTQKRGNADHLVNKGFNPVTNQIDGQSFLHSDPWDDTLTGPLAPLAIFGPVTPTPIRYNNFAVGGQFDLQLGDVTITDIPAYGEASADQTYFLSAFKGSYNFKLKSWSNELRLSGETGALKWQTGLNVYRQVNSDEQILLPLFLNTVDRNLSKGVGIYAHGTYSVSDTFRVTLGGRYSSDRREGRGVVTVVPFVPADTPFTAKVKSDHFDWKVGVEYDVRPGLMLYANVQTGYQPATYNTVPNTPTFNNRVKAPTITAYVAGFKGRFFGDILQINNEAFYYNYKNLPLLGFDTRQTVNPLFNAELVEVYGDQLDMVLVPSDNDRLNLSVGYLHGRQTKAVAPINPAFGAFSGVNASGLQLPNAPDWTISAGYYHDFQMSSGYVRAQASTRIESSFWGTFAHIIGSQQKSYMSSDASLTYFSADNKWSIGAWIKNIENEAIQGSAAGGSITGTSMTFLQPPRTFGGRVTFDF